MDEMDLDDTIYVLDTPDRMSSRKSNVAEHVERKDNKSAGGRTGNSDSRHESLNQIESHSDWARQGGSNRVLKFKIPRKIRTDHLDHCDKSIIDISSSPSPSQPQRTLKFRKGMTVQEKAEDSSLKSQSMNYEKAVPSTGQNKSTSLQINGADPYSNGYTGRQTCPRKLSHNDMRIDSKGEDRIEGSSQNGRCLSKYRNDTSRTSGYSSKGKEKTFENSGVPLVTTLPQRENRWNMNSRASPTCTNVVAPKAPDSTNKASHMAESPKRVPKRFVRNGLISPQNIAKGKMIAGQSSSLRDPEQKNEGIAFHIDPRIPIDISDCSTEGTPFGVRKGKDVILHPQMSNVVDKKAQNMYDSETVFPSEDCHLHRESNEEVGNWRRTRGYKQNTGCSISNSGINATVRLGGIQNGDQTLYGTSILDRRTVVGGELHQNDVSVSSANRHVNAVPRRTLFSASESSRGTKRLQEESSSTRQRRTNQGLPRILNGKQCSSRINDSGCTISNNVESRDWQLEADERFARELQEQLYREDNLFSANEMDENIALALLQSEQEEPASNIGIHQVLDPRASVAPRTQRRPSLRSSQPASNRRGARSRVSIYRRAQPRSGVRVSSSLNIPGPFPLDMSVDTRLDILEALEAASDGFQYLGMINSMFVGDDIDENDYERLLALDENNHEQGASTRQINSLPQSIVQTDNFEDNCAICLETPSLGETVRHLPCFHKFHKECIDQWLGRKAWCPVCKSSVAQS